MLGSDLGLLLRDEIADLSQSRLARVSSTFYLFLLSSTMSTGILK